MKHSFHSRFLAMLLAVVMVFSMLPTLVFAEDTATYTKITSAEELTTGKYVMVVSTGYGPGVLASGWLTAEAITVDGDTVTDPAATAVWDITVDGSTVKLTDSNGVSIAPKGGNNNGIQAGDYSWAVTCTDGTFQFAGQGEDTVILASNKGSENKFRAYKSATVTGNPNGYPSEFTLYKLGAVAPARESGLVTDLTTLQDGDTVVVFNPANAKALSTTYNGYYNNGVDVTFADGKLSGYTDAELWTLGINEDGTYTFSTAEGKKLSMGASYGSMPLDDVNTAWNILDAATEGYFYIQNTVRGNYLEWYASKGNWSSYGNVSDEALFAQQIYLVVQEETTDPDPDPDPVEPLFQEGDQVVIYNPANLKALSTTYTGFYNNGTDITLEDGVPVGYTETDIWTVGINEDGSYTFSTAEGKKLSMGASYTSTPLDDVNTAWNVLDAATEGCYYIQNTVRGNYLEWYASKGNWSSYSNVSDEALFAQAFYVVPPQRQEGIVTELQDGDTVVVFNPANMKALSTNYTGYYNLGTDVTLTEGKLSGYTAADVWTVGVNEDGSYTFSTAEGKKLSMGASYTSTPLDDVNTGWNVLPAATADCFYIQNAVRGNYLEWYASKGNWSSYSNVSDEALFAQQFYLVVDSGDSGETGLPAEGDQVVIYNVSAQGVLALQDDNVESPSITSAEATVADGKATVANGGLVFTVEKNGDYYRFHNETFGYLCSNGTGNNAFYATEPSEDADWTLATQGTGYTMESRTAKFNGKYSQYMEYYAGAFKTYSMYNVTDYDIYTFLFYPCANEQLTGGVVNQPAVVFGTVTDAYVGADYTLTFTVDSVFGVESVEANFDLSVSDGTYTVTIPADQITGESLTVTVTGVDAKGVSFSGSVTVTVKDEPAITDVAPAAGSQTGDNKRPEISAVITNAGENPTVTMTVGGEAVEATFADGKLTYTPAADLADGRTTVTVTVTRADGKTATKTWSFTVGEATYQLYFGQLHSHTTYSDGSGSLESALEYVGSLPDSANVDFVAFTDHSNYFDKSGAANPEGALYDMSLATEYSQSTWKSYKDAVSNFNLSQSDVIALGGFEMTWSGGPGHINTWVTPGVVSRNNTTLNKKTADAGMKAYYALLSQSEGVNSISQFNHPGSTFGTFTDFSYYDALIDSRMYLVEVGNGEGAIGAGGYYPSYEYYTMALDKGWHLAPTNNQDNHKGKWGNANDARDVILTDDFTEDGLYEAIRNYRVYATEDKNLEIRYTVNDQMLGSILSEVPEELNFNVQVFDPDSTDSISKVEIIVNSGKVAYTWSDPAVLAAGELTCTLEPTYSYYYIRVTQGDGDLAVTAPVWVGETLKLGISSVTCGTATPVTGEELEITTTLFNSEATVAKVKSVVYTTDGDVVLATDTTGYELPASGSLDLTWKYTPDTAKVMNITATVVVELDGQEYTFSMGVELDVLNADELVYIGIDASHYNEYVAGNYKDSMGNFGALAAGYSVRTVELKTGADLLAACENADGKYKAIILTAPSRRDGSALRDPYATYSDSEVEAIEAFNKAGGTVILCGWGDYYESYASFPAEDHMAAQQNKLLAAMGSSLRVSDDETKDNTYNGGQAQRLYLSSYNFDSFLLDGVEYDAENPHNNMYTELYSQYGGASIHVVDAEGTPTTTVPDTVTPVVYGFDTTYSSDDDKDSYGGLGAIPKYTFDGADRLMVMATEQLPGRGLIVVSGAAFLSNFEVQATISDSGSEKNYSNYKICENLVQYLNPVKVTEIAEVQKQTEAGFKYTIEGVVTSNASGYDKDTAFFDCIYVQDATGGICCFPVAGEFKVGDLVRVTGTTDFYQGEPELQVSAIVKIGEGTVEPIEATAAQVNDGTVLGSLITVKGTVVSFELANGLVQTIMVKDSSGDVVRVFIDGYITTANEVENLAVGASVTVTGLASYDDTFNAPEGPFPRIRIRNRADIVCEGKSFVDVPADAYYFDAVYAMTGNGFVMGTDDTHFSPYEPMTRGQLVTILYRMAGEPEVDGTSTFTDVEAGKHYTDAVIWAAETGITKGYGDGTFRPNANVTRAEMITFLFRYDNADVIEADYLSRFPDRETIPGYASDAMNWAVANGLLLGTAEGELQPRADALRCQAVTVLYRYGAAD